MKKLISFVLCLSFILTALPAIARAEGAPLAVSAYWRDTLNPPTGRMKEYVENQFGIALNIIEVPIGEYDNRRNMAIASGDLPDIFQTMGPDDINYSQMLTEGGIIAPLDPYLDAAPHLKAWVETDAAKLQSLYQMTGQYTAIPRGYCHFSAAQYYRQDLLDKYNLSVPDTVDEFVNAMKVLSKGEGKYALTSVWTFWGFSNIIASYNGLGTNGWMEKDGRYSDVAIWEETREALRIFADLYAEGVLHPEFMILNDFDQYLEKFATGDVLEIFAHVEANYYYDRIITETEKQMPGAKVVAAPPVKGPKGRFTHQFLPYSTNMHINAKTPPEKAEKIVAMFDFLFSPAGYEFNQYGIPGVHYTIGETGEKIVNMEEVLKDTANPATDALSKWRWYSDILPGAIPAESIDAEHQKALYDFVQQDMLDKYSPVVGYISENNAVISPELTNIRNEYFVKFITGEKSLDADWEEYVNLYKESGYLTLEAEVNQFMGIQ